MNRLSDPDGSVFAPSPPRPVPTKSPPDPFFIRWIRLFRHSVFIRTPPMEHLISTGFTTATEKIRGPSHPHPRECPHHPSLGFTKKTNVSDPSETLSYWTKDVL